MDTILIERAGLPELDQVASLFDAYRQFYGQAGDVEAAYAFLRQRIELGESILFWAREPDGTALGFTQLYPSFSSVSLAHIFILNDLFVVPGARRRGVGEHLLAAAAKFARSEGAVRLALSTAVDNAAAQALYERTGWRRDEQFYHYNLPLTV